MKRKNMRRRGPRILLVMLVLCLTLSLLPGTVSAADILDSGKCGENVTWTLDADGTLTISGTGDMYRFNGIGDSPWPWWEQCDKITTGVICSGVTSVGQYLFADCINLTSVTIPDGVTSIELEAFWGCSSLPGVTIPKGVTRIERFAFWGCSSLTSVTIPKGVTRIVDAAFSHCSGLTSVTIPDSVTFIDGSAFYNCSSLTDVYYTGSEEQWQQVEIYGEDWFGNVFGNATIHYNSVIPGETAPNTPVVCGEYASDFTTGINFDGSDFTFTLSSLGDKAVPENITALQTVYNESGQLVSVKQLPSTKDGASGVSFKGSVSVDEGQKCSMFVLDGNSAPMIEKYILT